jgi:hypothetical protein
MNPTTQFDLHPDAESLNAFVEQALPRRERARLLAHLADCGRCRQVVMLAQQAAANEEPAQVPAGSFAVRPDAWFRNWRLVWVPAAALAVVVALAFLVHLRQPRPGPELARFEPRPAPQIAANTAKPSLPERANAGRASSSASLASPRLSPGGESSVPAEAVSRPQAQENAAPAALGSEADAIEFRKTEPSVRVPPLGVSGASPQGFLEPETPAQFKPAPAVAAWEQQQRVESARRSQAVAARATQAKISDAAEHAQISRSLTAASPAPQFELKSASSASFKIAAQQPMAGVSVLRKAQMGRLPSGLTAVSSVTALHRTLAVDQAGTVFLSEDSGSHWEPIARQWAGRAVEVRLQQPWNSNAALAPIGGAAQDASKLGAVDGALQPAQVFEIVNDSDLTWVSADGRNWKAK